MFTNQDLRHGRIGDLNGMVNKSKEVLIRRKESALARTEDGIKSWKKLHNEEKDKKQKSLYKRKIDRAEITINNTKENIQKLKVIT